MNALTQLRDLIDSGMRDHDEAWALVISATSALPEDTRVVSLRAKVVDLLQAIEIETILGGESEPYRIQLANLLDWIEKHS